MAFRAYRVAALYRYPLKSAAGIRCDRVELDRFGVRDDRRWVVIDGSGTPITQRELPALARLRARTSPEGLDLAWGGPGGEHCTVRRPAADEPRFRVTIWNDELHLPVADHAANGWMQRVLGREARLAYMPDDVERPVNPRYAAPDDRTSLTDGYPLHLIGSGSMDDLNARLDEPVGVERFRANIYIDGPPPFDEDRWKEVRVGEAVLRVVKPCPRCAVTTVDPSLGTRGKEPLRTLSSYRKREGGVMFGQNALHAGAGTLSVGDAVEVLSRRGAPVT